MTWTTSEEGYPEFESVSGARMRIVPSAPHVSARHWKLQDLHDGKWQNARSVDSEEEGRRLVEAISQHRIDVKLLSRSDIYISRDKRVRTPWGDAQGAVQYAEGIVLYGTAGHGGFKLDAKTNRRVHAAFRAEAGWYEEDSDWAILAHTFPQVFTAYERQMAEDTLKNWSPHEYMAATGTVLTSADSFQLRQEEHARIHANDWMAIAAATSDEYPGMVLVTAVLGGKRAMDETTRTFLVPADEYKNRGNLAFPIDLTRHEEPAAASSLKP